MGGRGSTWVVGDVHGWLGVFDRLLETIDLDPSRDRLWLVGDLVNRGPDSAGVLRRCRELEEAMGDRFRSVLGNHDLHLFSTHLGVRDKADDRLGKLLRADDRDELLDWLRNRPLLVRGTVRRRTSKKRKKKGKKGKKEDVVVVHAGLWPRWTVKKAEERALELETILRDSSKKGRKRRSRLLSVHKEEVLKRWDTPRKKLPKLHQRLRDLYAFTHLRMLDAGGRPDDYSGPPGDAPKGHVPWYAAPERRWEGVTVVFGHWAAHGHRRGDGWIAMDSGCSWGRKLTALCLEDRKKVQVKNKAAPL